MSTNYKCVSSAMTGGTGELEQTGGCVQISGH